MSENERLRRARPQVVSFFEPSDRETDAKPVPSAMPDEPAAEIQAFAETLRRLSGHFLRVAAERSDAHAAFSKQDLLAIGVLQDVGPSRMGALAEALGVGQSAVTPLVDRLEAAGAARRRRSDADRRAWLVELTPAGEAVARAEAAAYARVAAAMLAPLGDAERATLVDLLTRIGGAPPSA